jgi:hypothetical protein
LSIWKRIADRLNVGNVIDSVYRQNLKRRWWRHQTRNIVIILWDIFMYCQTTSVQVPEITCGICLRRSERNCSRGSRFHQVCPIWHHMKWTVYWNCVLRVIGYTTWLYP